MSEKGERIFSKKIAERWLNKVLQEEYSITVHPQGSKMPRRLLRRLSDEGWSCSLKDEKMTITSTDPVKLGGLIQELKKMGFFIEELG